LKQASKQALELIGCPHQVSTEHVVIARDDAVILRHCIGDLSSEEGFNEIMHIENNTQDMINKLAPWKLRNKSGLFIGARMGRPEKAKQRRLTGSPQAIFPVGEQGGRLRCFQSALDVGKVEAEFPNFRCDHCKKQTIWRVCETCQNRTTKLYNCRQCGLIEDSECKEHGPCSPCTRQELDISHYFKAALNRLGMRVYPDLIKGVRGTSNKSHSTEPIEKGILRAKHDIYVNKDGTTRYDMSQLPITHFKPKEVQTSINRLIELGYDVDIRGKALEEGNQILEIKPQDIILPALESPMEGADKVLFNCANFIDDSLEMLYGLPRFYNLKTPLDLVGHLVLCLAPHTSAGIVGRIIGFSKTQAFFAHPLLHSAQRRDCDGDESSVTLILDSLLNFSRKFLPAHRGSTQDAPLVLTSKLIPAEVDDMVFDMELEWKYPLEFYEACLEYKNPWDIKMNQLNDQLGKPTQYESMGFTHPVSDINYTNRCSAYKTLPSMKEKMDGQMDLAKKIRAVETNDVARLIIERHLIRDTKGNLRKFSMQQFRCVGCNTKFRRPPLIGKCTECKGKIVFTISEGSVVKYMGHSLRLARDYALSNYLSQSIDLLERRIHEVFGKDKDRQEALGKWVTA
ncbi:MAG: DNA polymerase II large subunit, partial [Candidatus Nanoarchaeia archaeon]